MTYMQVCQMRKQAGIGSFFGRMGRNIGKGFTRGMNQASRVQRGIGRGYQTTKGLGGALNRVDQLGADAVKAVGRGAERVAQGARAGVNAVRNGVSRAGTAIRQGAENLARGARYAGRQAQRGMQNAYRSVRDTMAEQAARSRAWLGQKAHDLGVMGDVYAQNLGQAVGRGVGYAGRGARAVGRNLNPLYQLRQMRRNLNLADWNANRGNAEYLIDYARRHGGEISEDFARRVFAAGNRANRLRLGAYGRGAATLGTMGGIGVGSGYAGRELINSLAPTDPAAPVDQE